MNLPKTLRDLLALPTATYLENAVYDRLEAACRRLGGVTWRYDRYGNLLAHYRRGSRSTPPLAFVAHTDHPGFVALEMTARRRLRAAFRGGVRIEYFPGARVRFWIDGRWTRGRVRAVTQKTATKDARFPARPEEVSIDLPRAVPPNAIGMWDLPEPTLRNGMIVARDCDDIAGVAALVTLLQRLSKKRADADVYCLFTRAEEIGFIGAIGAARARTIPQDVPVFSIETSRALPHAPLGAGPIVRVGDRSTVFTPPVTAFCVRVAQQLAERRKSFAFQRQLMDGGTCEAHAFLAYGYRASGICLALGNYHNMDTRRQKIGSEYVSLADWRRLVDLLEALVLDKAGCVVTDDAARAALDERFAKAEAFLRPTPAIP